jgi:phenylacetic acid degradation operon negative regulatory protein
MLKLGAIFTAVNVLPSVALLSCAWPRRAREGPYAGGMGAEPVPDLGDSTTDPSPRLRPQALMLAFLGNYVRSRDIAVFSGSFIEIFARLGVGEHAVRSTLSRMVGRDLLARHRQGRRMYFGLTERSERILLDGEQRVWGRDAVNTDWDGRWTVLAFSLPESWQRVRHDLRSRLTWAGFGSLGNGMWIAPGQVDLVPVVAGLGLNGHVKVFTGPATAPTDVPRMIADAFDLGRLIAGYRAFLARWDRPAPIPDAPDDLARYLWMTTEWLQLIRLDPRLPAQHLPPDWPAVRGQHVLRELAARYGPPARALADEAIEFVAVPAS